MEILVNGSGVLSGATTWAVKKLFNTASFLALAWLFCLLCISASSNCLAAALLFSAFTSLAISALPAADAGVLFDGGVTGTGLSMSGETIAPAGAAFNWGAVGSAIYRSSPETGLSNLANEPGKDLFSSMGADAEGKQEIDPMLFGQADIVVADSKDQCIDHGDCFYAVNDNIIDASKIVELGHVIENKNLRRTNDQQITIADLTGVAIQDIQITKFVFLALAK